MSDNEAPAMSAPEPVAAPAPAPAAPVSAAPVFDNAKVDELKLQATDKVQELYKKGKDKLDQVKIVNRYDRCLLYTSPSPRDVEESRMPSSA